MWMQGKKNAKEKMNDKSNENTRLISCPHALFFSILFWNHSNLHQLLLTTNVISLSKSIICADVKGGLFHQLKYNWCNISSFIYKTATAFLFTTVCF